MNAANSARRPGRLHTRRARISLLAGAGAFALIVLVFYLFRPEQRPYTPGAEAAVSDEITSVQARDLPDNAPRLRFTDAAEKAGLRFRHFHGRRSTQLPEDMGSGAAWGDYDGDGDPDLYLVNESGPLTPSGRVVASPARSSLFRNDGGRFTDVTNEAGAGVDGLGMGAAWGDHDGDGDLDLVVTRVGTNVLLQNNGDGTFTDVSDDTGIGDPEGFWTGASWADYDADGDLDLYITGYVQYRYDDAAFAETSFQYGAVLPFTLNPSSYTPERNLLFRNEGSEFEEVAAEAGVSNPEGRSLSASWCDFDGDGRSDLYVANDISDNVMFWNRGDGGFVDVSHSAWVADYRGAMGLGVGDWDNDGDLDIYVTHWIAQENALYENLKEKMPPSEAEPMHFIDQSDMLGLGHVALDYIGWGTGFADYDNDGRLDLFVTNGSTFPMEDDPALLVPMKNQLFWNGGRAEGFHDLGPVAGRSFSEQNVGRGSASADYDGDGDLDVVVVVNGGPVRLLRNDGGNANGWLRVILRGTFPSPPFAEGVVVRLRTGDLTQVHQIGCGSSYLSQDPPGETHFGVGGAGRVDALEIRWPDGRAQSFADLPVSSTVLIVEGEEARIVEAGRTASP